MIAGSDSLDDISLKILEILSNDSSRPFVEIARQLEISDATVHLRVRRLLATGAIKKFTISVDHSMIGYENLAFIGINLSHGATESVEDELLKHSEILEIHELHGHFDLLVKLRSKSLDGLRETVVNKIRRLPNVVDVELMLVLRTVKEEPSVSLKGSGSTADSVAG